MSLEELYELLCWPMRPDDEVARRRFEKIVRVFELLVEKGTIRVEKSVKILDLAAGTGIAGAALAKVLREKGIEIELTVIDAREKDLPLVNEWLKLSKARDVKVKTIVADIRKLHEFVEKDSHNVALLWGLTMPHFDPFDVVKIFANTAYALKDDGIFMMEESDRVYGILYRQGYKDFLVETKREGYTLVSVHEGYNLKRGMFRRTYYKLPGFEKIAEEEHRLWDIAGIAGIGSVFFREFELMTKGTHGVFGVSDVLVFKNPRKSLSLSEFLMEG